MRFLPVAIALAVATAGWADTITLKNGQTVHGTYLGGSARQVRIEVRDDIRTIDVADIVRIEFSSTQSKEPEPPPEPVMMPPPQPEPVAAKNPPVLGLTLRTGTNFTIRMIDAVDSQTAAVGQSFAGSLDAAVTDEYGQTLIPRGADVVLKLVDSKQSGKITGRTELALSLMSIRVNGQMVDINTQTITQKSDSRGERSGKVIGGSAIGGAILGGILGGGKGAAIGAGAGAAAGTGVELATNGQRVRVPSETRLTFVLDSPVRI